MSASLVASASHIGGRDENQDAAAVFADPATATVFAVVADGMGGHEEGALAARQVIATAEAAWSQRGELAGREFLAGFAEAAHQHILERAQEVGADARAVLAALWLGPREAVSIHAGDCRVLQFGETGLVKRTLDHSLVQLKVLKGILKESDMADDPGQSRLTTSVGGPEAPEFELTDWSLADGRHFVVCSDGFWSLLDPGQQAELFRAADLQSALDRAIAAGMESAAEDQDNTTAVLIHHAAQPPAAGAGTRRRQRTLALALFAFAAILAAVLIARRLEEPSIPADAAPAVEPHTGEGADLPDPPEEQVGSPEDPPESPPTETPSPPTDGLRPKQPPAPARAPDGEPDRPLPKRKAPPTTLNPEPGPPPASPEVPDSWLPMVDRIAPPVDQALEIEIDPERPTADALTAWLRERGWIPESGQLVEVEVADAPLELDLPEGGTLVRLRLIVNRRPVDVGEYLVVVVSGRMVRALGRQIPSIVLPERATLAPPQALHRAARGAGLPRAQWLDSPELWISLRADGRYTLAWRGRVLAPSDAPQDWLVDAHSGELLVRNGLRKETQP
jgi:serine/threonine protein phosphatase PrpC